MADKEEDFEEWYRTFPKHVAKGAARKAYKRARAQGASADDLKLGALAYAVKVAGQDTKFTKHPATWLNAECWADEPTKPEASSAAPQTCVQNERGGNGYARVVRGLSIR